jgi:hypothetical protein
VWCLFDPWIRDLGWENNPGTGMNIPDHFQRAEKQFFGLKILKFFYVDPDRDFFDPGSGFRDGKIRIRILNISASWI